MREENKMPPSLQQAVEVLYSLISFSHSIKVFAGKWQLIRHKLEELKAGLIAIENCDSSRNPRVLNMVFDIIVSANECYDLVKRCVDLSYSGKLLMQSDLDVIGSKFDKHIKNLSGICTSGIVTHGFAIIVSRPGVNACKDDMRFYVRDLLTRLKVGDSEMKRQALVKLYEVVFEDDKYVKIILEIGDVISVLVSLLDSDEVGIQEESAKIVSLISGFDSCKCALIAAGVIGALVRVLESGGESSKVSAVRSLQQLTQNADNAWSVSAHGGVTTLLKICGDGDSIGELVSPACGVLRNLAAVQEIKRFMIEDGVVGTFVKLAQSEDEAVQISSVEFLQSISSGDETVRQLVAREGGIAALIGLMDPSISITSKSRAIALRAAASICFNSTSFVNLLTNFRFMDKLLFFLRKGDISLQELALKVASKLSGTSDETKKAMGEAGFMPEFVRFLHSKSFEVREMAAEALSSMVSIPKNRKKFVQDDVNVGVLVQLLDQEDAFAGNDKHLISILMSLTNSNSARRKIVSSGCLKNIAKLAETTEVSDAKRLIKKLSANKFRNMLSGIWHH